LFLKEIGEPLEHIQKLSDLFGRQVQLGDSIDEPVQSLIDLRGDVATFIVGFNPHDALDSTRIKTEGLDAPAPVYAS
jgi:hypothetical protein